MKFKKIFSIVLIICFQSLQSTITDISVCSNGKQNIFLFGDLHVTINQTQNQVDNIMKLAKLLDALVIIESMKLNGEDLSLMYSELWYWGYDFKGADCITLEKLCRDKITSYENIEYRAIFFLFAIGMIPLSRVILEMRKILTEITTHEDLGKYFGDVEKKVWSKKFWTILEKYQDLKYGDFLRAISIKDLCKLVRLSGFKKTSYMIKLILKLCCCSQSIKKKLFELIVATNNNLIELKAIKLILENTNKRNIFICAGGYHTNIIGSYLQNYLGYKKIKQDAVGLLRECGLCCCKMNVNVNISNSLQEFIDKLVQEKKEDEEEFWV